MFKFIVVCFLAVSCVVAKPSVLAPIAHYAAGYSAPYAAVGYSAPLAPAYPASIVPYASSFNAHNIAHAAAYPAYPYAALHAAPYAALHAAPYAALQTAPYAAVPAYSAGYPVYK